VRVLALAAAIVATLVAAPINGVASGELAGSSWRLVNIASMDDSVVIPDDPAKYTLELQADGTASMVADCNRGTGSWTSVSSGRIEFGRIAATMAICAPGSLSEEYLAQFQWVRSYVLEDGHLFLATMADGSIIEFEPHGGALLAATVLGEDIRTTDAGEMQEIVLSRLFDQYAADHDIEVADAEIDAFVDNMKRGMRDEGLDSTDDLTAEEAVQAEDFRRDLAGSIIWHWKINRQLYRQLGGRVIYQQFGPEPLDAYRQFLEEQQRAGAFAIHEKAFEDEFWSYFTDDSRHSFFEPGTEASAFETPPWKQ